MYCIVFRSRASVSERHPHPRMDLRSKLVFSSEMKCIDPVSSERAIVRMETLCRGVGIDDESDQVPEGHMVNALALRGDEGRGTLR
jgi:hypothetical protein